MPPLFIKSSPNEPLNAPRNAHVRPRATSEPPGSTKCAVAGEEMLSFTCIIASDEFAKPTVSLASSVAIGPYGRVEPAAKTPRATLSAVGRIPVFFYLW